MKFTKLLMTLVLIFSLTACGGKSIDLVKSQKVPNLVSFFTGETPTLGQLFSNIKSTKYENFKENDNNYVSISYVNDNKDTIKIVYYVNLETKKVAFSQIYLNDKNMGELFYFATISALAADYEPQKKNK